MKYSVAAATVLAGLGCTQAVRREDTRLFSVPPQPTPNEATPTNIFSILPVSSFPGSESQSSAPSQPSQPWETPSSPSMSHVTTPDPTISIQPPVTSGNVTAPASPVPTSSSSAPGSSASGSATQSGTHSGTSTSTPISTTSMPAAAPTAFESNLVAGVVALAALAVAI